MNIAEYRGRIDKGCTPEFSDSQLKMEGLVHPLIEKPVENDFSIDNKVIITGPNAAGKSTFIKALAICAILAQSINTVTATRFILPKMTVMTCMALRDDVISHESYYYREANYIKRILEEVSESKEKLFIVIDEILKGTNTTERVAASKAILNYLEDKDVYVIIATHDMELTSQRGYVNFHFDSQILENEIVFDYKIHEGASSSKNAIALLEYLQYPKEIITNARSYLNENRRSI
jgi:DNA mismatch repair ATPase MutS